MSTLTKINDIEVKPLKIKRVNPDNVKAKEMFPEPYCQIGVVGKKKSGKGVLISYILRECAGLTEEREKTKIVIFASTVNIDNMWRAVVKTMRKKGYEVITYTSTEENGVNQLDLLCKHLRTEYPDSDDESYVEDPDEEPPITPKTRYVKFEKKEALPPAPPPPKPPKLIAPDYIFVFDDLFSELKNNCIAELSRNNRHYKSKTIYSEQVWNDLSKGARHNLDFLCLFPKISVEKLKEIHNEANISIPFNEFLEKYQIATSEQFNFLYINTRTEEFRKNFNERF